MGHELGLDVGHSALKNEYIYKDGNYCI